MVSMMPISNRMRPTNWSDRLAFPLIRSANHLHLFIMASFSSDNEWQLAISSLLQCPLRKLICRRVLGSQLSRGVNLPVLISAALRPNDISQQLCSARPCLLKCDSIQSQNECMHCFMLSDCVWSADHFRPVMVLLFQLVHHLFD